MERIAKLSDAVLRAALVICVSVLVICVTWQVSSRYLLNAPSTVTEEIARFTLMWFALLAAAYVLGGRRHLAIDLFASLEVGPVKRAISVLLTVLIIVFALAFLAGGWFLASETLASGQVTPTLRLKMGYIYLAVPIASILMLIYCGDILRTALGPDARGPNDPLVTDHTDDLVKGN
ncbi:TRAP transporter small permease [Pararhodobacter sp.]|uniref:TRAP transporter small permease n=1 Tax=Pararhodobacter sp. TaxID=2127056 RepID=UPI002AFEF1B6|nr:TRAP transporter small permease [Pararhodobacter sp.]